ncbi:MULTISPECIES: helix-turn-helix domain-containing protein [unclassified Rhodococcus (in: high G+C Gram-positive bacteria)]|uniref:helix-turn-helix domain-containing protein n=1 Tax=unclassified Rhodococcus (in: high G+C Gram-positive bacteria) TaxID=192944 RepID=UPI00163AA175|nr:MULTISPECIES: helix-turn-helix domain-containing protein [unclassified Rhodococcus (in: high G+C Gram-positive bacteria)]MBC2644313.1 helix-turn-helix domain-containing protein [Rhodococcus sp. 3A]MBC2897994.1 helix-turn-helix domain-containing protein [Rhodococcus sp. 4CII]
MPYWSTSDLSPREQASYWGDVVCEAFTPLAPKRARTHLDRSATAEGVPGWVRSDPLADTNCAEIASCTQLLTHGPREVRRAPVEALFVNLQLSGVCYGEQDGRRCIVSAGSYAVFDTTRPYTLEFNEPKTETSWRVLSFRVPRDQWALGGRTDGATARAVDTTTGAGNVVGAMMWSLWNQRSHLDRPTATIMERSFADVLSTVMSTRSGQTHDGPEERDAALRLVVRHHIRSAVPLGRVTAEAAAREAAISVRTLHRLFQAVGTSFADCVREERLSGAMDDLASAPLTVTIGEIAVRWGFCDSSHLTRTFQRYAGCTPTEYRAANSTATGSRMLET